jgi:hypothetical protein
MQKKHFTTNIKSVCFSQVLIIILIYKRVVRKIFSGHCNWQYLHPSGVRAVVLKTSPMRMSVYLTGTDKTQIN